MDKGEKAIKGLECCIKRDPDDKTRCGECPYEGACLNRLKSDVLVLLKDYDAFCKWLAKDIMVNTDPDDDYYNPEVACRRLHKLGYVEYDAEKDAWRVNDGQA